MKKPELSSIVLFQEPQQCCGCSACVVICPRNAIHMEKDQKGFLYPVIDHDLCIKCRRCMNVCDFKKDQPQVSNIKNVVALQHKDRNILKLSSSGGAFTAISDYVLKTKGLVYGAVIDSSSFIVHHTGATTTTGRDKMRGSKYVQSEMGSVFQNIKTDLQKGTRVLFSGTPCQCAGLKSYLGSKPDNLLIVELLCHGVPSNQLLQEHIKHWEKKKGKVAVDYQYRSKKCGYEHTHVLTFVDGDTDSSVDLKRLIRLYGFSMRPSCYVCPYTSKSRQGDFTIGDLWEAEEVAGINDHRGVSLLTVNSENAEGMLSEIEQHCRLVQLKDTDLTQNAFSTPVSYTATNDEFWRDYELEGYGFVLNKYAPKTIKSLGYQLLLRLFHHLRLTRAIALLKRYLR